MWKKQILSQNNVSDPFRLTMKGYYITSTDLKPVVFGITPYPPTPPSLLVFMISHLPPLWGFLLVYGNGLSTPGQSVPTRVFFFFLRVSWFWTEARQWRARRACSLALSTHPSHGLHVDRGHCQENPQRIF